MADTIESFVAKLQAEGVRAGQREAEKIRAEAQKQADQALRQGQDKAARIIADAEAEARNILARSRTELDLAARDTVLRLREALGALVGAVVSRGAEEALTDAEFLRQVLHELVITYARAETGTDDGLSVNVPAEMCKKLTDWAISEVGKGAAGDPSRMPLKLRGTLKEAGFEYSVAGGTVEVTLSSVVEALSEIVSPGLQELLGRAMDQQGQESRDAEGGGRGRGTNPADPQRREEA